MINGLNLNSMRKSNRERLIVRSAFLLFFGILLTAISVFVRFGVQSFDYHPEKLDLVGVPPQYSPDEHIRFPKKLFLKGKSSF